MGGVRYRYFATGFPMEYWHYYDVDRKHLQKLYVFHAVDKFVDRQFKFLKRYGLDWVFRAAAHTLR